MQMVVYREDRVWETVLELLSSEGRLARYQRLLKHELSSILKSHSKSSLKDLSQVYKLVQRGSETERVTYILNLGEQRIMAMLYTLIHCMRCWVESESPVTTVRRKWRIAHS